MEHCSLIKIFCCNCPPLDTVPKKPDDEYMRWFEFPSLATIPVPKHINFKTLSTSKVPTYGMELRYSILRQQTQQIKSKKLIFVCRFRKIRAIKEY